MSKRIKVMSVFGTRPEAIKMAPLVLELQKHPELESVVCITAQHREMLDSVMDCFGIRADYDLNIMQQGQDLTAITTRVLERMRALTGCLHQIINLSCSIHLGASVHMVLG